MMKYFKTGIFFIAISISLVSCRETEATDDVDDLSRAEMNSNEDGSKVKIKTDDSKIKIKTDDDGNVKKKVKIDNDDN
jgi:hypothetical protein